MKILFAYGVPHLPQVVGGLQTNTHDLALALIRAGHDVSVMSRLSYGNVFGLKQIARMKLANAETIADHDLGYTVHRCRRPWDAAAAVPRPDIVVAQDGQMLEIAEAFHDRGIPVVGYMHGPPQTWKYAGRPAKPADLKMLGYIANSEYTARMFRESFGLPCDIIRPLFKKDNYIVERTPQYVSFINPTREKGVELALKVAALLPQIPFLFVLGWPLPVKENLALRKALAALPNVTLHDRVSDMRRIYRMTRILLVPSQGSDNWKETWGRVASEAHYSGIPVVGSDCGGLPEAVGVGGQVLGADEPAERWAAVIERLWRDEAYYAAMSRAALDFSNRPELDSTQQVNALLRILGHHAGTAERPAAMSAAG